MSAFLLFYLVCLKMCYTRVPFTELTRSERQTDVSYGSPAYKFCECGRRNTGTFSSDDPRIIGGKETMRNEFPWMVAMIKLKDLQFFCGGTILNDRYVVTAAHCKVTKEYETRIVVGVHNICKLDGTSVIFAVEKFIPHPSYDSNTKFADIMLVKLIMRITFNIYIRPICLPKLGPKVGSELAGSVMSVLGWGLADIPERVCGLRATNVTLYKSNPCRTDAATLLCAGSMEASHGTCSGDSGGPLQLLNKDQKFELIGIVSSGITCGDVNYPDFYTNVPLMIPWIMKITTRDSMYCWR